MVSEYTAEGTFFYGNDALWVTLPRNGELRIYVEEGADARIKFPWWRTKGGTLRITGRELHGQAGSLRSDVPDGYGASGFQSASLEFPAPGCWEITGAVDGGSLSFVVLVTDQRSP